MRGEVLVSEAVRLARGTAGDPFVPVLVVDGVGFGDLNVFVVGSVLVVLKEVAVYVPEVDELNVWSCRAEVEGAYLDGANEGGGFGACELSVQDIDKMLG